MNNLIRFAFSTLVLLFFSGIPFQTQSAIPEKTQPSRLSVNFLTHSGQVFLNGYPVSTPLYKAVNQMENFQFSEIAQRKPFFGWVMNSDQNNTLQTAFHILISSSLENIQNDKGDFWDSGKVESNDSQNISYAGKNLQPNSVYFWKVKTWDNHGVESAYSEISQFKMAETLTDYATARYPLQKMDESPVAIKNLSANIQFIDFGKDGFGRIRITLLGKSDTDSVSIRLGEAVKDGRIDRKPSGTIRFSEYELALRGGWNTYIIAIKPDKRNTGPNAVHMPEYIGEVTPFRYCEVEGYSLPITTGKIVRETVFYPFDDTDSEFISSDTVLNKVWDLCKYTMKATSFTGTFIDGDRERIPYEADALINQLGYYSVSRDFSIARHSQEYLIHHATWPTEWILQSVMMGWNDYLYTGNDESLQHFYADLKAKTLSGLADGNGFISTTTGKVTPEIYQSIHLKDQLKDIVDWPHTGILGLGKNEGGETDGFVFKDVNTVVNAYYYFALKVMATIATQLDKPDESKIYSEQAAKLKQVFNSKLIGKKSKIYLDGIGTDHSSLHANMFPLAFGLAPEKNIADINQFIQSRGLACSVYGSQFLMDAIYDGNNADYGLSLLTSTAERSWYNMIRAGSTIAMEAWDNKYKPNQDWNHAWGAAPANIIPRKLMGIEPLEPGFSKIRIKPQPSSLEYAEIKCPTIRGDVWVSFQNKPQQSFILNVTTPANSTTDVYLPFWSKSQKMSMNGTEVKFRQEGNYAVIENVGSGKSVFEVLK